MARYGILIDYDYCTGCHTCEVACQQEHDYAVGTNGIVVREYEYEAGVMEELLNYGDTESTELKEVEG